MSKQKLALIEGSYPSLMAGGVVATVLSDEDLNEFRGAGYWGKTYYAAGGNTVQNKPQAVSSTESFALCIYRNGGGSTIQVFYSFNGGTATTFQRVCKNNTAAWDEWHEVVLADGSYPTLGAGYLEQEFSLNNNTKTGWANVGSVPVGNNYSCIFFVNGVQHVQGKSNTEESGILEVDYASDGAVLSVLSGNLSAEKFCATVVDNTLTLYHNMTATYNTCQFTILAQKIYGKGVKDSQVFAFASPTYGQSAPANAVYAVVRNNASADDNGYSFDTNYVWHNNGQGEENTLKDGTKSFDFNDYIEEGKYELHGYADSSTVNILTNFPTSSLNSSATNCDWYLVVYRRSPTYITQIAYSVRADNAISIRSRDNGEWREWRLLFEDGVAQSIPTASETVIGGAKIWRDSDGYLNIDTQ